MEMNTKKSHHGSKHATVAPEIETIVIFLEVDKQFWSLEVPRGYPDVVFRLWVVELSETPVNEAELKGGQHKALRGLRITCLSVLMVNHDVVRLDITMHNTLGVTKVQSLWRELDGEEAELASSHLEELKHVEAYVHVGEARVQRLEIDIVNILRDEAWYL